MCRSIQTLRPPYVEDVTPDDVHAAALQYVRKVAGMRAPAAHNREAFDAAVTAVADATAVLLRDLVVRGAATRATAGGAAAGRPPSPRRSAAPTGR